MNGLSGAPIPMQSSEPVNELFQALPPVLARGLVYLLVGILVSGLLFSYFGRIDGIVTARATMTPRGLAQPVQSTSAGRVTRVAAREGDVVQQGQVLFYLESEAADAHLEGARQEVEIRNRQLQEQLAAGADSLPISETRVQLAQAQAVLVAAERALSAGMILAPTAGQLTRLGVRGPGESVNAGQLLAEIAPGTAPLVFEAQVPSADIARVAVGQSVLLKVDAYPYQEYGVLNGRVVAVSPDVSATASGGAAYRVILAPEAPPTQTGRGRITLRLGLGATAEIVVDRHRILDLLFRAVRGPA